MKYDVCIIGAGPAGLMASLEAASDGARCVILEKNSTAGRKLVCTGRGRCNVTHEGDARELLRAYGDSGRFLRYSLHGFSPDNLRQFFADNGLQTKVEKGGCVFPLTDRASDVKRVLVDLTRRNGVEFIYGRGVESIQKHAGGFFVATEKMRVECKSVIIATGGVSWPETGSTGDGYEFAKQFGHEIVKPKAALVPLITSEKWARSLQGVAVKNARITSSVNNKKIAVAGAMIFTNDGIGGPAVFDLSRLVTDELAVSDTQIDISIDFAPAYNETELEQLLVEKCQASPRKEVAWILIDIVPRALGIALCGMFDPDHNIRTNQLSKENRRQLVSLLKKMPLTINRTRPIKEAVVTKGGVSLDQIDDKTMQSKLCEGLFFAGEVMDIDGPCGGYNLQIAWSTGVVAGCAAAK